MDYYQDIKITPDNEMRANVLLNKVYSKLHKTLFIQKSKDVGISFPQYKVLLGNIIRIHGSEAKLNELKTIDWLGGLAGYSSISPIQHIPHDVKYRVISRKQPSMTEAKLRRLIKRGSITPESVKDYKVKMFEKGLDNPYLELDSTSSGHKHRRYIAFGELLSNPLKGDFDSFGLSKKATIPWF
ncbi:type I-F CRISPR-associated endoribonuclease Cas6/Csy4 [Cycloclasticus pugetii]|jgi:CRISPR-associated endonuclease Csy4|uniref:type I-F CRISPR-associated endoribonuclease Cas6/Csy4 n=1 Tax=Cycloclasticus pugetii TaxID=34068 RepID=UPI00091C8531|nr:type I-F CRISPR-associated endoribonuclease Cas6/Csy4 [Cycloclasticus pugetii]MDF1830219.1 type I-F CRISPR-associated endoribonuclease Cas6/Csy4 [Cycloclasticus pugetii]SHI89422.1 CRISPR-associated protein, Csy4 family [Cycloclasticus pugetii]